MFRADAGCDAHQAAIGIQIIDGAKRREHRAQLKGDEAVGFLRHRLISADDTRVRLLRQPIRLKDDRRAAIALNALNLAEISIGVKSSARLIGDEGAGDKFSAPQHIPRQCQGLLTFVLADQVGITRVHIHRRRQARFRRPPHMIRQPLPVNLEVVCKGQ